MIIREIDKRDAKAVAEIEKLCFSSPWSEDGVISSLDAGDVFLGAFDNDALIGYVGVRAFDDCGEIGNIATHPDYRRQGVGKALLSNLNETLKAKGVFSVVLEVRESNSAAISLYEGHGYKNIGIRKNLYDNPREDGIVMKLEIM